MESGRLFVITSKSTGLYFLVGTVAEISVLPASTKDRRNRSKGLTLRAANFFPFATFSLHFLTLQLGLRKTLRWVFVIADIGSDFVSYLNLDVSMCHHWLSDNAFTINGKWSARSSGIHGFASLFVYESILASYLSITQPHNLVVPAKQDITYQIVTTGPLVTARPC